MNWDGADKRRFVRAEFPCKIIIYVPKEHSISTKTKNISAGGVRVILLEKLDIVSIVGLDIFLNNESVNCKGRVVWSVEKTELAPGGSTQYDTGIEYYQIEDDDRRVINNLVDSIVSEN